MAFSRSRDAYGDQRGHSSAVSAVLYSHGDTGGFDETRGGSYVYGGDASSSHEWEFRTRLRVQGLNDDRYVKAIRGIIDGLRGDAFVVAQEVGLDILWNSGMRDAETSA